MGPADQSYQMQQCHISARSFHEIVCFPYGSCTPIPVSKQVKALGVQKDNMFSPSVLLSSLENFAQPFLQRAKTKVRTAERVQICQDRGCLHFQPTPPSLVVQDARTKVTSSALELLLHLGKAGGWKRSPICGRDREGGGL